jgi:multicomponent Na+:H+ antiporter subunit E
MILFLAILLSSMATFGLVTDDFTWENMTVAFVLSGFLMYIFRRQITPKPLPPTGLALRLALTFPILVWYVFIDVLKGTYKIVMITLGLQPLAKPGIVKIPIGLHSQYGVGPVGFFVTLSPGSFLVDIDWDERVMLVHYVDASDPDAHRADAERYYRLWERKPPTAAASTRDQEESPDA